MCHWTPEASARADLRADPLELCRVAGGFRFGCGGSFFPLDRYQFRDARLLHRNAIEHGSHLHSLAIVRYHDELRLRAHLGEHFVEAPNVGFVQRRVHFVEDAEWAGLVAEHGDKQRQRSERLFAAGEQENILQTLSRWLRSDVDAGLARAIRLAQAHLAMPAAE